LKVVFEESAALALTSVFPAFFLNEIKKSFYYDYNLCYWNYGCCEILFFH